MQPAKIWAWAVIIVSTLATISPIVPAFRGHKGDSFPLSWFPMFANHRPEYETPIYMVGIKPDGSRVKVEVNQWTRGGFNQGRGMLRTAVRRKQHKEFCAKVAKRVVEKPRRRIHRDLVELRIVQGTYDRQRFFGEGDHSPLREKLIARCRVKRPPKKEAPQ